MSEIKVEKTVTYPLLMSLSIKHENELPSKLRYNLFFKIKMY